jgi:predicted amidohydrolase YtcJ
LQIFFLLMKNRIYQFLALKITLLLFSACSPSEKADLLIFNATVYTLDENQSITEAIVVRDGLIIDIGREEAMRKKYTFGREEDLRGFFVYPGFIDAHAHFFGLAASFKEVDLRGAESLEDVVNRVRKFQMENPQTVIRGRGWDQNLWEDSSMPNNELLSEIFPDIPVLLKRIDGHAMLVNKLVIERNGIHLGNEMEGGAILSYHNSPSGVLIDNAMNLVKWPSEQNDDWEKALIDAQRFCYSRGLTGLSDMGLSLDKIALLDSLYTEGKLHIGLQIFAADDSLTFEEVLRRGPWKQERLSLNGFKFYADGALGSRGACLLRPYSDDYTYGFLLDKPNVIKQKAQRVYDAGMQLATHAIGDSANRVMLQIYQSILEVGSDHRWKIEHAQVVNSEDVSYFSGSGIIPSVQPTHGTSDMLWAVNRLGNQRIRDAYRYEDLRKAAGIIALGTDFPIEPVDPLGTFRAAVIRQNDEGVPEEGFQMENALSPLHTLMGMTIWAAYSQFRDFEVGSIEKGKYADFVVLSGDLLDVTPKELRDIYVKQTYSRGVKVYSLF